ncbi:hypothetical protein K501DRAFT_272405 [Backusella circina FSU 941]|nr:hypothetical protein K501DRAFT_272405 [Backusella circina FSU 941]
MNMSNSIEKLPAFSAGNATTSQSKFICEYIQEFRNIDRYNKGYITDVQALNYFRTQHSLSKDDSELIIDISNTDNNSNLNEEEFAIAMHMIDILNNKDKENSDTPLSLAAHEEQKNLKGFSKHDLRTHLGHHNIGRRCKELLDILYKEQSVWNSNRQEYTDHMILEDSLERLRDNDAELIDVYNELRRQVEECKKSTDTTSQQISNKLIELKSKPITQISNTSDGNESSLKETDSPIANPFKALFDDKSGNIKSIKTEDSLLQTGGDNQDNKTTSTDGSINDGSAPSYISTVKPLSFKENNDDGFPRYEPEYNFAPQPQGNLRNKHMTSEHRLGGIPKSLNDSTITSLSNEHLDSGSPTNESQNQTRESDIPSTMDKRKNAVNQKFPVTSELATSTSNIDHIVKSGNGDIITKGIIVPSVIGEFPGDFGKSQPTSQKGIQNKRAGHELKNTGFFSGYFSGAIDQLKSAVGVHQANDHSGSDVRSPIVVPSVIGEFPGNFGKGTLESVIGAQPNDSSSSDVRSPIVVPSVIGEFPGNFGKDILKSAIGAQPNGPSLPYSADPIVVSSVIEVISSVSIRDVYETHVDQDKVQILIKVIVIKVNFTLGKNSIEVITNKGLLADIILVLNTYEVAVIFEL